MNILKSYSIKVHGFSIFELKKILNNASDKYTIRRKCHNMYVIQDVSSDTMKLKNLKCICETYTINPHGAKTKFTNNSAKCFNCKKAFGIDSTDCLECNRKALNKFQKNEIYLIK